MTKTNARAQDIAQDQALMVNPDQKLREGLTKEAKTQKASNEPVFWTHWELIEYWTALVKLEIFS